MKHPHLPNAILTRASQWQTADAFGLRQVQHQYIESCGNVLLCKMYFQGGETKYDPYTIHTASPSNSPTLYYKHSGDTLTLLDKERDLSLWERILPYPWGFIFRLHKLDPKFSFAEPSSFRSEWDKFFQHLNDLENILSSSEISALNIQSPFGASSIVMRFLRRKCVGASQDPTAQSLGRRQSNGGLVPADLYELWGTSSCFFNLRLSASLQEDLTLHTINSDLKQALLSSQNLVRYRIATLEDGVIEMGL